MRFVQPGALEVAISTKQLDDLIAQCEDKLTRAQQRVSELQAELKGLRTARGSISGGLQAKQRSDAKSRGASFAWRKILGFIQEQNEAGTSIDSIAEFVHQHNLEIQIHAIRSQLSNYNKKGIVTSLGDGVYKLTGEGKVFIGDDD
jgi:septal ring factor EnvC (AmiA/AmiB activator)